MLSHASYLNPIALTADAKSMRISSGSLSKPVCTRWLVVLKKPPKLFETSSGVPTPVKVTAPAAIAAWELAATELKLITLPLVAPEHIAAIAQRVARHRPRALNTRVFSERLVV